MRRDTRNEIIDNINDQMLNAPPDFESSFAELYRQYYPQLYKFLYRLTGDPEEAGDIVQDTFTKLYRFRQRNPYPDNPGAWLYKVAANACYSLFKQKERRRQLIETDGTDPRSHRLLTHLNDNGAEERLLKHETAEHLRKALNQIPVKDRLILELFQDGLSYAEIADIMKVRASGIGKKLFRARNKLARQIKKFQGALP